MHFFFWPQENREDAIEQIVEVMIERRDLWASLYDYEGSRLLEMLPKYNALPATTGHIL